MRTRSDSSLAALLLVNRLVDAGVEPLRSRDFWALIDAVGDPATLLGADARAVAEATGVDGDAADRIGRLLASGTALALELERLEHQGLYVLSAFDDGYPARLRDRLGNAAPPVLHVAGDVGLLADDGIGVVGSRSLDEAGADVARRVADYAAGTGLSLVSGGARGADQVAMAAAFEAGGTVVGVLADALTRRLRDADTRRAVTDGRVCLLTPYKPTSGFSVGNAMGRNKLIYALSRVTLVVAASLESGGTWAGATEALRRGFGTVAVWTGASAGPGNAALAAVDGARPLATVDGLSTVQAHSNERSQLTLGL